METSRPSPPSRFLPPVPPHPTLPPPDAGSRPTCSITTPRCLHQQRLTAGIGRKSIISSPGPPSTSPPHSPSPSLAAPPPSPPPLPCAVKVSVLDQVEASAQHHGLSERAHCTSVSAGASLSARVCICQATPSHTHTHHTYTYHRQHPNINKNTNKQIEPTMAEVSVAWVQISGVFSLGKEHLQDLTKKVVFSHLFCFVLFVYSYCFALLPT